MSRRPGMTEDQELRFCLIVGYGLAILVGAAGVIGGALSGYGPALGGGIVLVLAGLICLLITAGVSDH